MTDGSVPIYSTKSMRWLVPREGRRVDPVAAHRFSAIAEKVAAECGFDKVTAAVVLIDLATELIRENPRTSGDPGYLKDILDLATEVHFGVGR